MRSSKSEEGFPLLLLYLEDSRNSPRRKGGIFFDKNRYNRISEGAGNVFTQWPSHVSMCWLSTFVFVLFFFVVLMVLLAASARTKAALPHCAPYHLSGANVRIYLVHCESTWSASELQSVEEIIRNYPGINIDLIVLTNGTHASHEITEPISHKSLDSKRALEKLDINVGKKDVVQKLKHHPLLVVKSNKTAVPAVSTLAALLKTYPNIETHNETMEHFFEFTPLRSAWKRLSLDVVEFAARVSMLWEYGGISFKLPKLNSTTQEGQKVKVYDKIKRLQKPYEDTWRAEALLSTNITSFKNLPTGVVNIDDEGLHMETKTPCHAYFGEMMMNCRQADRNTTVESIVVNTLKTFCSTGAVSDEYCFNFAAAN